MLRKIALIELGMPGSAIDEFIANQSLEYAPALVGPAPDGFSAPLQTRRSAWR